MIVGGCWWLLVIVGDCWWLLVIIGELVFVIVVDVLLLLLALPSCGYCCN